MIFDTHIHTKFSTDSTMPIEEVINTSKKLGIGVCLTDHLDLAYPNKDEFQLDIPGYFKEYSKYRNEQLLLGIEIGLSYRFHKENSLIAKSNPFDYVIGSIHAVFDEDIYLSYGKNITSKQEYFDTYLKYMLSCINEYKDFDSLAHIDYPCRYCPFENQELIYSEHADILDEVFKALISSNKVIELNTARIANKTSFENLVTIYNRYSELGGKYITIGSDAHTPENIARNFALTNSFLERTNLRSIYFKNRKPEFVK